MKKSKVLSKLLLLTLSLVSINSIAGSARTFLSVSGVDVAPCGQTAPCKTLGFALPLTNPNGEVVILTSGAYGNNITITQSVNIKAALGTYAGIGSFTGLDGIIINAPGQKVTMTNLHINGTGGNNGIKVVDVGTLHIIDSVISNMAQNGILQQAGAVVVFNSAVNFNNVGINTNTSSYAVTKIERSHVSNNTTHGLLVGDHADVDVVDSALSGNGGYGINVNAATSTMPPTVITVDNTELLYNAGGGVIVSDSGGVGVGVGAHLIMSKSKIRPVVALPGISGLTITGIPASAELINNFIIGSPGFGAGGSPALSINRSDLVANSDRATIQMPIFLKQGSNFLGGSNHPLSLNGAHCDLIDPNTGLATGNTCGVDYMRNDQDFF